MGAKEQGADATQGRWLVIPRTLCFVLNGDDVLLMKRAAHRRVFPNRYNGVGGHVERGEDPQTCARREIMEETGLAVTDLRLRGVYNIDTGEETGIVLYIYTAISHSREITMTTDEGTLYWVHRDEAHTLDLVEDLPTILPRVLAANDTTPPFSAHLSYDDDDNLLIRFADD
ncbi:MAG: NUDIX domain-containing protein [Chloroflexota bacterium]